MALALLVCFSAPADQPPDYYSAAEGKTGAALRQALHTILRGQTILSYDADKSVSPLKFLDEDPANTNNVFLLYAQRSEAKTNYGVATTSNPTAWNIEHVWPVSYGFATQAYPAPRSDLHHMFAEDARVNSSRGNKLFDESDPTDRNYHNPANPGAPLCSSDTDSWEPPPMVKGDIARALFYMAVRYEGDTSAEQDLKLTDRLSVISSATNYMGRLTTLLLWHQLDPVDDRERLRNDRIFTLYQNNRNPFVDHPEWVAPAFYPELAVRLDGTSVKLSWDVECPDARVDAPPSLFLPWQLLDWAPNLTTNGVWQITLARSTGNGFFRLRLR